MGFFSPWQIWVLFSVLILLSLSLSFWFSLLFYLQISNNKIKTRASEKNILKNELFRNKFENVCITKLKLLHFLQLYLRKFPTCIWNTFVLSVLLKLLLAWLNVQLVVIYSFCLSYWVKMREDIFADSFS